jgi:hypothetical protein
MSWETVSSVLFYPRSFQAECPAQETQYTKPNKSTGQHSNPLQNLGAESLPKQQKKFPGHSVSSQSCNANSLSRVVGMLLLKGRRISKAGSRLL